MKTSNTGIKGIYKRNENTFEANVSVRRKKSGKSLSVHIGSYPTVEEAIAGKTQYLSSL